MPPYNAMYDRDNYHHHARDNDNISVSEEGSVYGILRSHNAKSLTVHKSSLEVDYDKNITDLYQAITNSDWESAISACEKSPEEARTWVVRHYEESDEDDGKREIMWRFLPIHSASARQPPKEVISALLKAYPDGAKCVDDQGMYALHYACGNQAKRDVIRMLLVAYPDAAAIKDPNGMLPMHYLACWGPSDISIMDMVLVAHRQAVHAKDADGNTPMDLAKEGEYEENEQVVDLLKKWSSSNSSAGSYSYHSSSRHSTSASSVASVSSDIGTPPRSSVVTSTSAANSTPTGERRTPPRSSSNRSLGSTKDSPATPFLVGRLKDEISQLKDRLKESKWELAAQKNTESQASLRQRIAVLEKKSARQQDELELVREELDSVQTELEAKEEELQKKAKQHDAAETKLKEAMNERVGLRLTLTDLMEQHEKFKKKSDFMNDRLGSLSASLSSMMEEHKTVLKAMREREDSWKKAASDRRAQLQALMALENESTKDDSLEKALEKTNKEMEAIAAVIAAARQ